MRKWYIRIFVFYVGVLTFLLIVSYAIDRPVIFVVGASAALISELYLVRSSICFCKKVINLQRSSYLNGFRVWDWEKNSTFYRIGEYVGHGLCYEASALLVLILRGHNKTRYAYGDSYKNPGVLHCWVEAKAYGIWWVLDSTWLDPVCYPLLPPLHRILTKTRAIRKIPEEDFFSHEIAVQMAEMIKNPRSSYIFHDLACFRRAYWRNVTNDCDQMVIETTDWYGLSYAKEASGWNPFLIDVFKPSGGKPVTQRILREFVTHDNRFSPKRRSFRKAIVMGKTVNRCMDEASALHKKTGNTIEIEFSGITTYNLSEIVPS